MDLECGGCARPFKTKAGLKSHHRASPDCEPEPEPAPEAEISDLAGAHLSAWVSTVHALYSAGRVDARHESAITHGAVLSNLLDRMPLSKDAPKWHAELRQVRRELMGDDDDNDDGAPSAAAALAAALAQLGRR